MNLYICAILNAQEITEVMCESGTSKEIEILYKVKELGQVLPDSILLILDFSKLHRAPNSD